jgi:DNA-binding protein H-NS
MALVRVNLLDLALRPLVAEIGKHANSDRCLNDWINGANQRLSMSKTYAELVKQISALQAHAEVVKRKEIVGVIAKIRAAIQAYSITQEELYMGGLPPGGNGVAGTSARHRSSSLHMESVPKYRDKSGNVWGGRGPRPRWLREAIADGKSLGDFAV